LSRPLQDRLAQLRRGASEGVGPPASEDQTPAPGVRSAVARPRDQASSAAGELERLERALTGEIGEGLSLKERLERLVSVAARGRPRAAEPVPSRRPVPIEELIQGQRVTNQRGEFFLVEGDVHLDFRHGQVSLSRFQTVSPESPFILTGDREFESFDISRAVFLDTETTGLAGGTGTAAFLVGVGFVDGDRFCLRQYFMRDYHEEAALLRGLAEDLRGFRHLVTFNGRIFDIPLLEARYRLNRDRFPLGEALHLDLLPPARRLWKERLESCRLQTLENALLGVVREGDVPGEDIPGIYFNYVRTRDGRALARVLDHNRIDILSLAALAALACQWVEDDFADDPRDAYSLARVFERVALHDRCEELYRRVLESSPSAVRNASLLRLADRARRGGDLVRALAWWQEAADQGEWLGLRNLAVHHEHRSRDLGLALRLVEQGLAGGEPSPPNGKATADFRRRRERLKRKLGDEWAERRPGPRQPTG